MRGILNPVPFLPKREKGLGDEDKRAKLGYSRIEFVEDWMGC
jgi:hypothetical protein